MLLTFVISMAIASHHVLAQEITITLEPGWNWISYPNAEVMDVASALGDFAPMNGDRLKSRFGSSTYINGQWRGGVTQFTPGWGYMYYSSRTASVIFAFSTPSAQAGALAVTTSDPADITATTVTCGGSVVLNDSMSIYMKGVCWATHSQPTTNDSYSENGSGSGTFTAEIAGLAPNTTYYVRAYAVSIKGINYGDALSFTTLDDHDYVDLGLPTGTLWATCNVGASTPEGYGDYFAWGETQPKDYYYWNTYQYCNGSSITLTKYCNDSISGYNGFIDNLTTLQSSDDAASTNWGSDWRMPTEEELQELCECTTHTSAERNGVWGWLFTGCNGNTLFLPFAGYRDGPSLYSVGSTDYYWSSSLYYDYGMCVSSGAFCLIWDYFSLGRARCCGLPVRAVRAKQCVINATANPSVGGEVSGSGTYKQGQSCTLTATANTGYIFTNWTENGYVVSTNANYTFTVNGARNLVANFTNTYTISVSANLTSGGSVNGGGTYTYGQSCTVNAMANTGYNFTNWTENGDVVSTDANYTFIVTGNRNLVANFTDTSTINVSANPTNCGSVNGGGTYTYGQSCTVNATAATGYTFVNWTENSDVVSTNANYTFTVTGDRSLVANFDDHPYVDLGLPSGILWATCNVGATNPEDYGDYFAWGETTPKSVYDWNAYQYCMGSSTTLTKYCSNSSYGYNGFTDNLTTLLPEDDAATANWGNGWRMPTKEEFQELYDNTTVTWTTQNGVNGRLFTAMNGNTLFLPTAGYRNGSSLSYAGSRGFYWSSSLNTGSPSDAWYFRFRSDYYYVDGRSRYYGQSVRPVHVGLQN